jgi:hypothetical protein
VQVTFSKIYFFAFGKLDAVIIKFWAQFNVAKSIKNRIEIFIFLPDSIYQKIFN